MDIESAILKVGSRLVFCLPLVISPIYSFAGGAPAPAVDIHFVELDEQGIRVDIFYSNFQLPPPNRSFTTPGESVLLTAGPDVSHIGRCEGGNLLFNILEPGTGAISDQIQVIAGCGDSGPSTTILFLSDSEFGGTVFSAGQPNATVTETGIDQFVATYFSDQGTAVNLFAQSDVDVQVPEPATLALLGLGLAGLGFSRRRKLN